MAIKDYFAKNGYARNVIFVFAASFFIMLMVTYLLFGPTFLKVAPIFIMLIISGLIFLPNKLYLPFCVGMLLQYGLFSGLMLYLIVGSVTAVYINLLIGVMGYLLLVTSIWQAVLGEWKLPRAIDIATQVVAVLGLILSISVVAYVYTHKMPNSEEVHKTY